MHIDKRWGVALLATVFAGGIVLGQALDGTARAQSGGSVYELRTYTANEGKMEGLLDEFRGYAARIFERHGMENVGYWVPTDAPRSEDTLIYILRHDSREAAQQSWSAFIEDPEWRAAYEELNADGRLAAAVESMFLQATDFSPMR
ncbi:MAG: NIPSNAP family protein [Acidobacteria bacterium]|nr:NIPSNAP family protein [Acidobacteriota bacterium]